MNELKASIDLLRSVYLTMDTISITGIDNQDKFVGCANAVSQVAVMISKYIKEQEEKEDG